MSREIKKIYKDAGLTPPEGKGVHTKAFHEMSVAIKKENPVKPMKSCYAIAMKKLGRDKAVKVSHYRKD